MLEMGDNDIRVTGRSVFVIYYYRLDINEIKTKSIISILNKFQGELLS